MECQRVVYFRKVDNTIFAFSDRKREGKTGQYGSDLREGPVDGNLIDMWLIINKSSRFAFK